MIRRMKVVNFKALKSVETGLEQFTVLIGPNDTGKSSFLEAVYAISQSAWSPLSRCFWSSWNAQELVFKQMQDTTVTFQIDLENSETTQYRLDLRFPASQSCELVEEVVDGRQLIDQPRGNTLVNQSWRKPKQFNEETKETLRKVSEHLHPPVLARWSLEDLASPSRLPPERSYPIDPSGYGLATCVAEMRLDDLDRYTQLVENFRQIFPTFRDIRIKRVIARSIVRDDHFVKQLKNEGEGYALFFVRDDGVEIPANLASGGTLVALAFLTLTHLREPRKLLLIEEPENGLHPSRLGEIIEVLRTAVGSQPDSQVILTTHSPLLLNYVEPQQVRVFLSNKEKDDNIEIYNLADVPDIKDRLKYMMLGELVYNEGEEELIKEIQHAHSHSG